jgi:flagellar hook assembly protein FlgD
VRYGRRARGTGGPSPGTSRTGPRRGRHTTALALALLAVTVVVTSWVVPRVDAGAASWLAKPAARGAQMAVTVAAPNASPLSRNGTAASPAIGATAQISPGWRFNMIGAVYDGPAAARWWPPLQVRTSADGASWSAWRQISFDRVGSSGSRARLLGEPLWVGDAQYLQYRLTAATPSAKVEFTFINTLGDATLGDRVAGALRRATAAIAHFDFGFGAVAQAAVPQPAIVTRAQWGADESWRTGTPAYATVRMAFVHHTVSGNDYTQEQAPALVRAIYYYHAKSCGYRDIGYNFLIDRYGTIYEGRYGGITRGPVGAQTLGFNTGSTGISIIGDFSSVAPPTQAIASLEYLLASKLDIHHINPTSVASMVCGTTDKFKAGQTVKLPAISGHRDANFTACPGDALYALLPAVRAVVADRRLPKIYGYVASTSVISPNGDGQGDSTTVTYAISETADWTVTVTAADGSAVRSFAGNGQFVTQTWDGLDASGAPVPDGTYTVTGTATSPAGSATPGATATPAVTTVVVDTKVPAFTGFLLRSSIVNPEGAGAGDRVSLSYALSEPGSVQVIVRDESGVQVREVQAWTLVPAAARSVSWDGRVSSNGTLVPAAEGQYTIEADGKDAAGNPCTASGTVAVDRTVHVTAVSPLYFSPNGDGRQDAANVTFELRRSAAVSISVLRSGKSVLSASLGSLPAGTHAFQWNGRDAAGKLAPGGPYTVVFSAISSTATVQAACTSIIDRAGPSLSVGRASVVRRARSAHTTYSARDLQSSRVHVMITLRRAGKLVKKVDCGWLTSGVKRTFTYRTTKRGLYVATFTALDQAANRQLARKFWHLRVK